MRSAPSRHVQVSANPAPTERAAPKAARVGCRLIPGLLALAVSTAEAFGAVSPEALDQAFEHLRHFTWRDTRQPLGVIETALAESASDPALRKSLEKRLTSVLQSGAPFPARQYACEKLSRIATSDSVSGLAAAVADPALSHAARSCLERIPDPATAAALRNALPGSSDLVRLGIINSLGVIRDSQAVPVLGDLLARNDTELAEAALAALGRIGTEEALEVLEAYHSRAGPRYLAPAAEALIEAAGQLATGGSKARALEVFRRLRGHGQSEAVRRAAFRGEVLSSSQDDAVGLLAHALRGDDDPERAVAARILAEETSAPPLTRFAENDLPPEVQVALLAAFRARQEHSGLAFAHRVLAGGGRGPQIAAIQTLGAIGRAQDVPALIAIAATPGHQQTMARAALVGLPDPEAADALAQCLRSPPSITGASRSMVVMEALNALASRADTNSAGVVEACLADPDEELRTAALRALAVVGNERQVRPIIAALHQGMTEPQRTAAESALVSIARRTGSACSDEVLTAMPSADADSRRLLLQVLGVAGGPAALSAVRSQLDADDAAVRESAFRVLAEWSSAEAGPHLLELAQSSTNANWRTLAYRGFVRLAREGDVPEGSRMELLGLALKTARNPEEKKLVIAALGEQTQPGAAPLLASCLDDPAVAQEACAAAANLAANTTSEARQEMAPLLRRLLEMTTSPEVRQRAGTLLRENAPE